MKRVIEDYNGQYWVQEKRLVEFNNMAPLTYWEDVAGPFNTIHGVNEFLNIGRMKRIIGEGV